MVFKTASVSDFTPEQYRTFFATLDISEQQRILAKKNVKLQKCSLAAQMLLGKILLDEFSCSDVSIVRDNHGKPFLRGGEAYVSISHTADVVAVAASDKPIGIDVEFPRQYNALVCKKMFSDIECEYINGDDIKFTTVWTLKEAVAKAIGQGVSAIRNYEFVFEDNKVFSNIKGANLFTATQSDLIVSICEID